MDISALTLSYADVVLAGRGSEQIHALHLFSNPTSPDELCFLEPDAAIDLEDVTEVLYLASRGLSAETPHMPETLNYHGFGYCMALLTVVGVLRKDCFVSELFHYDPMPAPMAAMELLDLREHLLKDPLTHPRPYGHRPTHEMARAAGGLMMVGNGLTDMADFMSALSYELRPSL